MNAADWTAHFTVWISIIGQTGFMIAFATRPTWRKHWVTRSLMLKSFAFWLLLAVSAMRIGVSYAADNPPWTAPARPLDVWDYISIPLDILIIVAVWQQFIALLWQINQDNLYGSSILRDPRDEPTPPASVSSD